MNRLEVSSGIPLTRALTVIVSVAVPRLIWTEPVGLAKSVSSKFAPLKRDMPLDAVPSSASVTAFVPSAVGRLKMMSVGRAAVRDRLQPGVGHRCRRPIITTLPSFAFV